MLAVQDVLEKVAGQIKKAGASRVTTVDTGIIKVMEEPACGSCPEYGHNLSCPPNIPPPAAFRRELAGYSGGVLFQVRVPAGQNNPDAVWAGSRLVHEIVLEAEKLCLGLGAARVRGLIAGCCKLCVPCPGPGSGCRHPAKARSSLEANGIDVVATCAAVGWQVTFPADRYVDWTGLVLLGGE